MNALDFTSILICLAFLGLGISQGFIKSISSLVAILVGLFCAKKLEPFISTILSTVHINNPKGVLGYIFVFFCIYVSVKIVLLLLRRVTRASGFSPVDRAFGGLLGFAKGIVIVVIACTFLQLFLPKDSAILRTSKLLPYSRKLVSTAHVLLPTEMYRGIGRGEIKPSREKHRQEERKGFANPFSSLLHRDKKKETPGK